MEKNERTQQLLSEYRMTHLLDDCGGTNRLTGLYDLIKKNLNENSIVVEIGSFAGVSTELFTLHCKKVYSIDPYIGYVQLDIDVVSSGEKQFIERMKNYNNVIKIKKKSLDAVNDFEDNSLDCVYIDGEHNYTSVYNDIKYWLPKIKEGGVICGHDYTLIDEVRKAVEDHFKVDDIETYSDSSFLVKINKTNDIEKINEIIQYSYDKLKMFQSQYEIIEFSKFYNKLNCKNILEIGSLWGGTFHILCKLSDSIGKKITIDYPFYNELKDRERYDEAVNRMKTFSNNVITIEADSHKEETINKLKEVLNGEELDFIFIDGDHTYEGVKQDYEMYKSLVKDGGYIAFHDINDTQFHRNNNCYVCKLWDELPYKNKIEFNEKTYFGGIGLLQVFKQEQPKEKLLFITPHLSTGGLPQVMVKQIELIKDTYDVLVIEYTNITGGVFVVQRNRILDLIGTDKFYSLGENKLQEIQNIINNNKPDIIHFEEIPELCVDYEIAKWIYRSDRPYKIIETTHSAEFNVNTKVFLPDKFNFVSYFSALKYINFDIPFDIVEYPVDKRERNKINAQKLLNLDPSYKHVICVGLFTPRKNQGYVFEIAKHMLNENILFHFIGNQAENFEYYWGPLMKNVPKNCIIQGERSDVDVWYEACDAFIFPSVGAGLQGELNPIVVKEALEWDIPMIMFDLPVYMGKYDNNSNIFYLNGDSKDDSISINYFTHSSKIQQDIKSPRIQIKHLLISPDSERQQTSVKSLKQLEEYGMVYTPIINEVYTQLPPKEHCNRPQDIAEEPKSFNNGYGTLTGGHYGCFLAHITELKNIDESFDYTLMCEMDAVIEVDIKEFVDVIHKACVISETNDIYHISLANNPARSYEKVDDIFLKTGQTQDLAHCYLIPNRKKQWWIDRINDCPWDTIDIWYNEVFINHPQIRYTTNKIYSKQVEGYSAVDKIYKK